LKSAGILEGGVNIGQTKRKEEGGRRKEEEWKMGGILTKNLSISS
jgi:hypothetical protein